MQKVRSFSLLTLTFLVLCLLAPGLSARPARADAPADIQAQIDTHNKQIADLEKSIAADQATLNVLGGQHQTLQSAIKTIDVSRSQTATQISVTQNKIAASNLKLQQLSGQISQKQYQIELDQQALSQSLRDIADADNASLVEQLFSSVSLADAWIAVDQNASVGDALRTHAANLNVAKVELAGQQQVVSTTKQKLSTLSTDLTTQKHSLDVTKQAKATLLTQTKNQESTYQQLIATKKAQEKTFEDAIYQLSLKLKSADSTTIPPAGKGILAWPLDSITVTQSFGKTTDSGRLYASGTHNGVDFAASIGTPVHATLTGTVMATNFVTPEQDKRIGFCQYGSWILIKHANGLATLYAHLSKISVNKGDVVTTGQVIGYSGDTGFATGPHLHLTVYNASSVSFTNYTCKSGSSVYIPIAPPNGYLDPMIYL